MAAALRLSIWLNEDIITVDLEDDATTLGPRPAQRPCPTSPLSALGKELEELTRQAGRLPDAAPPQPLDGMEVALQRLGRKIFDYFPPSIQERLSTRASPVDLRLRLDDQLVHIPWELAFDGREFLLNKFHIGRRVATDAPLPALRRPQQAFTMLIIANPTEDLPAAEHEGNQLYERLCACSNLDVTLLVGTRWRKTEVLRMLAEHDLVHYAGHAVFDAEHPDRSGWVFPDGVLTATELRGLSHAPLLVFANACQAGVTPPWSSPPVHSEAAYEEQVFGIGNAFLLAGTPNYLGTFCVVHDVYSANFAADFYQRFLQGDCLGVALAAARQQARQHASRGLLWASYVLYGDPSFQLPMAGRWRQWLAWLWGTRAQRFQQGGRWLWQRVRRTWVPTWGRGACMLLAGLLLLLGWAVLRPGVDRWTSSFPTLAMMPFEGDERVLPGITAALLQSGKVRIVERARVQKILDELAIDPRYVAPETVQRLGKLLAARLMAFGTLALPEQGGSFSLRVAETETAEVKLAPNETFETMEELKGAVQQVTMALLQGLCKTYPRRGRITHLTPEGVRLNIGTAHGLIPGLTLHVLQGESPRQGEQPLGQLLSTQTEERQSQARIIQHSLPLQPGWRVQETEHACGRQRDREQAHEERTP